jgi:type I restriction enzyme M protein
MNDPGPAGTTSANVGYEAQLWQMADALRGSMDPSEYKHVCLGLLFLKDISDAFEDLMANDLASPFVGSVLAVRVIRP